MSRERDELINIELHADLFRDSPFAGQQVDAKYVKEITLGIPSETKEIKLLFKSGQSYRMGVNYSRCPVLSITFRTRMESQQED